MRKIWLIVIALAITTVVALAFTWRQIPYLNTYLQDNSVITSIENAWTQVTDTVKNNPTSLLGVVGTLGTVLIATIRKAWSSIQGYRTQAQEMNTIYQQEKGSLLAGFNDVKSQLTGSISDVKNEYATLQTKYTTDIASIEDTVKSKDTEILSLSRQLTAVQGQLSTAQLEVNKAKEDLIASNIQKSEYQIALATKTVPTRN